MGGGASQLPVLRFKKAHISAVENGRNHPAQEPQQLVRAIEDYPTLEPQQRLDTAACEDFPSALEPQEQQNVQTTDENTDNSSPLLEQQQHQNAIENEDETGTNAITLNRITVVPSTPQGVVPKSKLIISTQREQNLRNSVLTTPFGDKINIFKYYCPLCMEYYQDILRAECCGNYICLRCTLEYLGTKGVIVESFAEFSGNVGLNTVFCPHCLAEGLDVRPVLLEADVRSYTVIKPAVQDKDREQNVAFVSPLKVGDSFDSLKRKMVPYQLMRTEPLSAVQELNDLSNTSNP